MRLLLLFAVAAPLFAQNPCPYGLSVPLSQPFNIPAYPSTNQVWVYADGDPNGCNWTYSTDSPSWIAFTSGPAKGIGYGNDTFMWSAAANVTPIARQAKISVTGVTGNVLTFAISQAGAVCAITLPQQSANIGVSGGSGSFQVQANCTWSARGSGWIAVPGNTGGTTNGAVSYTVAANGCATGRTGAISVTSYTASQQFQIIQDGSPANFATSPTSLTIPPAGVTGSVVYVTTGTGCAWSTSVDVSWITILSGRSGAGPGGISYSVPANSGPQRVGHISGQPGSWVITVTQQALPPPPIQLNAMVNAASNVAGAVSPGEIVTLYGSNIGPISPASFQVNPDGTYAKSLGGTRVLFDGVPAGLTYASAVQVNAVAPYGLAGRSTTQVQVEYQGVLSNAISVPVQAAHPGIFTVDASGLGGGAILNQDFSLNGGFNAAARGSYVMIYCTGGGVTNPPSVDATITPAAPPLYLLNTTPVSVTIGGVAVTPVSFSGAAPSQIAGLTQINAQVPAGVTPGTKVPVTVTIGTWQSQSGVTMAVK
jgi:uncharacterized protein (TIGR03437 family)